MAAKRSTRASAASLLVGTRKGLFLLTGDSDRRTWSDLAAALPRPHRAPRGARSARPPHAARRGARRSPRPDGVPLRRRRPDVEGGVAAAGVREGPRARPAASSITSSGSRRGTRASPASGTRAPRRRASSAVEDGGRDVGRRSTGFNDHPEQAQVDRRRRRTRRPTAASCTRSTSTRATPRTSTSGMSGGGVFESTDRGATWQPLNRGVAADFLPDPDAEYGHDPHCVASTRAARPAVPAEPLRHLPHRPRRPSAGSASARTMPKDVGDIGFPMVAAPARSATPPGCSRWTAPRSGRAPARAASPRCTARANGGATLEAAATRDCRADAGLVHGEAAGHVRRRARSGRALLRHDERRGLGEHRRGRALALHRPPPAAHLLGRSGASRLKVLVPTPAPLLHRRSVARSRPRRDASTSCWPTSTAGSRGSASA